MIRTTIRTTITFECIFKWHNWHKTKDNFGLYELINIAKYQQTNTNKEI